MAGKKSGMLQAKTKCDIVVEEILSMIRRGEYSENEKLPPEHYFVDYFGVSRVTIRESFKKLNMLGVVTIKQGEGTFVNRIDFGTMMKPLFSAIVLDNLGISQIYDARLFVESGNARLAARNRTEEELETLDELLRKMREVVNHKDTNRFNQLDILFHEMIGEMSRNHIMSATYKTIKDILKNYITQSNLSFSTVESSLQQHIEIVEAIREHNEEKARIVMENHVEQRKLALIKQFNEEGAPDYIKVEN